VKQITEITEFVQKDFTSLKFQLHYLQRELALN